MRLALAMLLSAGLAGTAAAQDTPRPDDARVYVIAPSDGAEVTSPVTVRFGLHGMGVAPAGVEMPETGHHHLLIDLPLDEVDLTQPLPATDQLVHFGGGQTETTLELAPGNYELRLLLADHQHIPHDPPLYSEPVTVTVVE